MSRTEAQTRALLAKMAYDRARAKHAPCKALRRAWELAKARVAALEARG